MQRSDPPNPQLTFSPPWLVKLFGGCAVGPEYRRYRPKQKHRQIVPLTGLELFSQATLETYLSYRRHLISSNPRKNGPHLALGPHDVTQEKASQSRSVFECRAQALVSAARPPNTISGPEAPIAGDGSEVPAAKLLVSEPGTRHLAHTMAWNFLTISVPAVSPSALAACHQH